MGRVNIWWPIYPADFTIDTAHLTTEEVGAYVKILNALWRQGGEIFCDQSYLAKVAGVSPHKWRKIKISLASLFTEEDGKWRSEWLSGELRKAKTNSEAKSRNARKRWHGHSDNGMQMHSNSNANASDDSMQMQCPSPSPSPAPILSDVEGGVGAEIGEVETKTGEHLVAGGDA